MNNVKGFRFHPTDQELIEFLHLKTFDRDSFVQVIDEVPDICLWEPRQLTERSTLQTGDQLWYFIYSPKYKYRNSKLINRTTREGYWKPTGNARKIIDPETGLVIGTKKTLVFYKGQCNDKNKIKTCWVMHEYELMASPKTCDIDQKTFNLCKLKKRRVDISSTDTSQSSQHNDCDSFGNQAGNIESYVGERSNQHNAVNDDVVSNLSSCFVNPVIEDAISKETLYLRDMSIECKGAKGNSWIQKLYTIEKDDESYGSVLTNGDETIPVERSNQHNAIVAAEGFEIPSSFKVLANGDETIPIKRSNQHNAFVEVEGFGIPSSFEVLANGDETILVERSNQHNAIVAADGFGIPSNFKVLANGDETIPIERSNQHNAIVATEGFGIPSNFEVFTNCDETIPTERSNQHNAIVAAEGFGIPSSFEVLTNGDQTIPIERSNQHNTIVAGEGFRIPSSFEVLTNGNEIIPIKRSNQHNESVAAEGFGILSSFEYLANAKLGPMDFQYDEWLSTDELLEESEATNNSNWTQNLYMTDLDDEFWNSPFGRDSKACLQEENIAKPKKRRRLSHDVHVETTEAQV